MNNLATTTDQPGTSRRDTRSSETPTRIVRIASRLQRRQGPLNKSHPRDNLQYPSQIPWCDQRTTSPQRGTPLATSGTTITQTASRSRWGLSTCGLLPRSRQRRLSATLDGLKIYSLGLDRLKLSRITPASPVDLLPPRTTAIPERIIGFIFPREPCAPRNRDRALAPSYTESTPQSARRISRNPPPP